MVSCERSGDASSIDCAHTAGVSTPCQASRHEPVNQRIAAPMVGGMITAPTQPLIVTYGVDSDSSAFGGVGDRVTRMFFSTHERSPIGRPGQLAAMRSGCAPRWIAQVSWSSPRSQLVLGGVWITTPVIAQLRTGVGEPNCSTRDTSISLSCAEPISRTYTGVSWPRSNVLARVWRSADADTRHGCDCPQA